MTNQSLAAWLEKAIADTQREIQVPQPRDQPEDQGLRSQDRDKTPLAATASHHDDAMKTGIPRKMVTIRRISSINPHALHSRKFCQVMVDNWSVIARKEHGFKVNELVAFFEPDSFIPDNETFSLVNFTSELGGNCSRIKFQNTDGYRVSINRHKASPLAAAGGKVRIMSEAFICRIEKIPRLRAAYAAKLAEGRAKDMIGQELDHYIRSADFSTDIGVTKWEAARADASINPPCPFFILGTQINRLANCPNLFIDAKYKTDSYYSYQQTVKKDGCSMTVYYVPVTSKYFGLLPDLCSADWNHISSAVSDDGRFGVCTANTEICENIYHVNAEAYWRTALRVKLHKLLRELKQPIAIQGELVGAKASGNPYGYGPDSLHDFFVFGMFDVETGERWKPNDVVDFVKRHQQAYPQLKHVPVVNESVMLHQLADSHAALQAIADGMDGEEGLVFKCVNDAELSFKVLNSTWRLPEAAAPAPANQAHSGLTNRGRGGFSGHGRGSSTKEARGGLNCGHGVTSHQAPEGTANRGRGAPRIRGRGGFNLQQIVAAFKEHVAVTAEEAEPETTKVKGEEKKEKDEEEHPSAHPPPRTATKPTIVGGVVVGLPDWVRTTRAEDGSVRYSVPVAEYFAWRSARDPWFAAGAAWARETFAARQATRLRRAEEGVLV